MKATVKLIKNFGKCDDANVFALYIQTHNTIADLNQLKGETVRILILKGDDVTVNRATNEQLAKAKEMIANGVSPSIAAAESGCSLATAYKLKKEIQEIEDHDYAGQCGPVTTRMMTPEERVKYGVPAPKPDSEQAKIPKKSGS